MKRNELVRKMAAASMAGSVAAGTILPVLPVMAATTANAANNTATKNDLSDADIIDTSKTGSLSIFKYDITSAQADGKTNGLPAANGVKNTQVESQLADYAIKGVEFTLVRLGNVETYSKQEGTENKVKLVYEIPTELVTILGKHLTAQPIAMSGMANECANAGVVHYEAQDIQNALADLLTAGDIAAKTALENYVKGHQNKIVMDQTDATGYTEETGLELGLYLSVETKVPEEVTTTVDPWLVQLPFTNSAVETNGEVKTEVGDNGADADGTKWLYNMTCYPKNQTGNPTLDKLVRNAHSDAVASAATFNSMNKLVSNLIESEDQKGKYVADRVEYTYDTSVTASTKDTLDYILVSKLPKITSEASYLSQYTFVDTLSAGQTYGEDVRIAFYDTKEAAEVNDLTQALGAAQGHPGTLEITQDYDGNAITTPVEIPTIWDTADAELFGSEFEKLVNINTNKKTGKTEMTVSFTKQGLNLINKYLSEKYIVVYYTAHLNTDVDASTGNNANTNATAAVMGDAGNQNDVVLTWERTSEGYTNTLEDRCIVYTYGIDLTKTLADNKNGKDVRDVQFVLYNEEDGYYVQANREDGSDIYYVTGKTTEKAQATVFSPMADGQMKVHGIEGDKYQLTEIKTADGYSLLKDQIVIDITEAETDITAAIAGAVGRTSAKSTFDPEGAEEAVNGRTINKTEMIVRKVVSGCATVDGQEVTMKADNTSAHAIVPLAVVNAPGFTLPKTGGPGMFAAVGAGSAAIVTGLSVLAKKMKKKA